MTKIVGITGGIGSGKTTLSSELKTYGFIVHDSDEEVKKLYNKPTKKFLSHLIKIGFKKCIKNKNQIDKKKIAEVVFSNKKIKENLESFIFTILRNKRKSFIKKMINKKNKFAFIDIPLLFENNLDDFFDVIISVISKKDIRFKRLGKSKNMNKEMFKKIIKNQTSDLIRKKRSDIIIYNNLTLDKFRHNIKKIIELNFL